jgi:hypothetical protein
MKPRPVASLPATIMPVSSASSPEVAAEAVGSLRLYPTDALDPRNGARLRSIMPLLTDESTRAFLRNRIDLSESVKQRAHFPLVIGNPPYRNNSNQTLAQVADRFPMLLRSSRANARARKRNIVDDYAWFFAAADHYVADRGLIAFVVSDSFCYATSYRFFREDLVRRYRVRHLINLGALVFRDVGPRTQFVIVVLERRAQDLARADDTETIIYTDLRPLAHGAGSVLGTSADPRLLALVVRFQQMVPARNTVMSAKAGTQGGRHCACAPWAPLPRGRRKRDWEPSVWFVPLDAGELPSPQEHLPTRGRNFTFFPAAEVVSKVDAFPNILHGDRPRRVFIKKWPGLITAFDELFRGNTRTDLSGKIEQFFAAVTLEEPLRETALDRLAGVMRATSVKSRGRLSLMAVLASEGRLQFDPAQIKRVVTGSAPNEVAWYPDQHLTSWIYYEPRLRVPRNVHEGRDPGYGTMSQWRDPQSHLIDPKFVFTTGTNPDSGLKAFVVPGDWMVKLHGGESQQFHYTGLVNPLAPTTFSGPNNLRDDARVFYEALISAGYINDDFLF